VSHRESDDLVEGESVHWAVVTFRNATAIHVRLIVWNLKTDEFLPYFSGTVRYFHQDAAVIHRPANGGRASRPRQCCAMSRWSKNRRVSERAIM
jgi:hypothetical protein